MMIRHSQLTINHMITEKKLLSTRRRVLCSRINISSSLITMIFKTLKWSLLLNPVQGFSFKVSACSPFSHFNGLGAGKSDQKSIEQHKTTCAFRAFACPYECGEGLPLAHLRE